MIWLNLQTTSLRAPEYIGSDPVSRATWLNVLAYSCEQENGGRIAGAATWKDRQWQQTCGVTLEEVRLATPLLLVNGDDIVVWNYPLEKQAIVEAKRNAGKRGGEASGEARREAKTKQTGSTIEAEPKHMVQHMVERKGMEGEGNEKGMEEKKNDAAVVADEPPRAEDEFAQFWNAYPRRVGKANALKAWNKLKIRFADVAAQLEAHHNSEQWTKDGGQFIPHPATWLNQRRWEDELPRQPPADPPRAEWVNENPLAWLPAKVVFAGNHLTMLRERIDAGDERARLEHDALKAEHSEWLQTLTPTADEIARADAYYTSAKTIEQAEYAEFLKNYQP